MKARELSKAAPQSSFRSFPACLRCPESKLLKARDHRAKATTLGDVRLAALECSGQRMVCVASQAKLLQSIFHQPNQVFFKTFKLYFQRVKELPVNTVIEKKKNTVKDMC